MIAQKIAIAKVRSTLLRLNYGFWENGNYNLNIIGVRKEKGSMDVYDDWIMCIYKRDGIWCMDEWTATVDPGKYWVKNFDNPNGVAYLVPGQYRSAWSIGKHRGKYDALVQVKPVQVYRDNNKDEVVDLNPTTIDTGIFGINIHRSHETALMTSVDQWSAGCQVFQRPEDFAKFMELARLSASLYGNKFTYTLIDELELYK